MTDAALVWDIENDRACVARGQSQTHPAAAFQEQAWLLGQPPLGDYLEFVEETVVGGADIPRATVIEEWRTANDYYHQLERDEAGIADEIEVFDLDPALDPLVENVKVDPRYVQTFDTLPTRFAMVELDRMLVGHPYLTVSHQLRLNERIGKNSSPEDVFRFCQPLDRDEAPVKARKTGSNRYQFWSDSTDFRFQETLLSPSDNAPGLQSYGTSSHVLAAMIGYGSNFLTLIEWNDRLVLHNGHHRAYALRDLGFTHVPCIIQTVTRIDELNVSAARAVRDDPAFYFRTARPPIMKDFFDPRICKIHKVHKEVKVVEVSIEAKEYRVRDFADGA